ncbi:hypothetical protein HI914_01904 [Erysiphe necator]|uniref:Basic proline-rich protein n=1 Tax=Uncinula necator TaxID=52586 RepID=A0A0B1PDD3_UNCNE|nr:hypothetical protein HI914_01904 [Erysiphe necator]KHJ34669.1 hypothetical protein EV44_g5753 [Erysiphe necator]
MEQTLEIDKIKASRVPTLKLKDSSLHLHQKYDSTAGRPFTRRSTESILSSMGSPVLDSSIALHIQPGPNQDKLQSRFPRNSPVPPPISRTQSMPSYCSMNHSQSSQFHQIISPKGSNSRLRFPRKQVDEVFVGLPSLPSRGRPGTQNLISGEDKSSIFDGNNLSSTKGYNSLPRPRRPDSPRLTPQQIASNKTPPSSNSTSVSISPSSYSSRYNDQYITNTHYCYSGSMSYPGSFSSYSMPSTPTSARSRSSSISSLETIPDSPDAEEAAIEADRIARSKAEIPANCDETKTKLSRDTINSRGRTLGSGFLRDKRKRWSVCGAERRGDLNLDTIWED